METLLTNRVIGEKILNLKPICPYGNNTYWILANEENNPVVQASVDIRVRREYPSQEESWRDCPEFLSSMEDAWRVVDYLISKYQVKFTLKTTTKGWVAKFVQNPYKPTSKVGEAEASLPAEAICKAAMLLLECKESTVPKLVEQLRSFGDYRTGWDHYGAKAISRSAIESMETLILAIERNLPRDLMEDAILSPRADGSIWLTWKDKERELVFIADTYGDLKCSRSHTGEASLHEIDFEDDIENNCIVYILGDHFELIERN